MRINKFVSLTSVVLLVLLMAFQSCNQDDSFDQISEREVLNAYLNSGFKIVDSSNDKQSYTSKNQLKEALTYLDEYRIDTTNISINCMPLSSSGLKTRSEGDFGIGTRYGVTITQEKTLLTHKIYIIYTKINNVYTIESVTYNIDGFRLGNISTSAGNITQSSSTSSEFETTATYTINIGSYEACSETTRYRWNIYFRGGSSISFSATEF